MHAPQEHYRMDFKTDAYKKWILEYVKKSEKWKEQLKDYFQMSQTENLDPIRGLCRLANVGCPDYYESYAEYWKGLAGTMGEVTPNQKLLTNGYKNWLILVVELKRQNKRKKKMKKNRAKSTSQA